MLTMMDRFIWIELGVSCLVKFGNLCYCTKCLILCFSSLYKYSILNFVQRGNYSYTIDIYIVVAASRRVMFRFKIAMSPCPYHVLSVFCVSCFIGLLRYSYPLSK